MGKSHPILMALLAACVAAGPATRPAVGPSPRDVGPRTSADKNANAAADPLAEEAIDALNNGWLNRFGTSTESKIVEHLDDLKTLDLNALNRLSAWRQFARFFARLDSPSDADKATLKWLAGEPGLLQTLMSAVSSSDPPDRMLALLTKLHEDQGENLAAFPDLTTAFCVVWDKSSSRHRHDDVDLVHVVRLFRYYVNTRARLEFDLKDLPWQLSVYVIDNRGSEDDIGWALAHYAGRRLIGAVYFDVPYDESAFYGGADKQITSHPYTLPNLVHYGGVCVDQAYFASTVAKSIGVPACSVSGQGGDDGVPHAWVGYLHADRGRIAWNFQEGRYEDMMFWTGEVTEPQTRQRISEADVALLAELQGTTPAQRLASIALVRSADIAKQEQLPNLYTRAITLSPGNRAAWMGLADLGAQHKLSPAQEAAVGDVLARFALQKYPDFVYRVYRKLYSGREGMDQVTALGNLARLFPNRPDLLADIRIDQGDLLRKLKKEEEAFAAYGEVLTNDIKAGPIVLRAMDRVDEMLRGIGQTQRLAAIYKQVWARLTMPEASAYARSGPYFILGRRYAALLDELGDHMDAGSVRDRLNSLNVDRAAGK